MIQRAVISQLVPQGQYIRSFQVTAVDAWDAVDVAMKECEQSSGRFRWSISYTATNVGRGHWIVSVELTDVPPVLWTQVITVASTGVLTSSDTTSGDPSSCEFGTSGSVVRWGGQGG